MVHQPIEEGVLGPQQQTRAAVIGCLAPVDGGLGGDLEDAALAVVGGVLRGSVVDLLEHPRHRHHDGRLEHREHRHQILDVTGESDDDLVMERAQRQRPREHVRERQEHQQPLTFAQQCRQHRLGSAGLVDQVRVGQLAAFRAPCGARGVDQRRRIVGVQGLDPRGELGRVDRRALLLELVERFGTRSVDVQHAPQFGQIAGQLGDHRSVGIGFGEGHDRARIGQHPAHLLGRRGLVDRDGDAADREDRLVQDRPLVAGCREDGDPIARPHPVCDQTQCGGADLGCRSGTRHIDPGPVDQALKDHRVGVVALVLEHRGNDVVVLVNRKRSGRGNFTHSSDLASVNPTRRETSLVRRRCQPRG